MSNVNTSTKSKRATNGNAAIPDFGVLFSGYNHVLQNWAQSSAGMMKGASELSQEIMTFSRNRLEADADSWQALASCRDAGEFFECQREIAEKASSQYLDEASKLTSRMMALMNEAAASLRLELSPKA